MAVKIYADLTILTHFHFRTFSNDESPNLKSCAFTLDKIYLETDLDSSQIEFKKECLRNVEQGFELSEQKLDKAIADLNKEIIANGHEPLPFMPEAIFDASSCLPESHQLDEALEVDVIWSQPLIWRLITIFNLSQYLTVAAFYARKNESIENKLFRNYYKAMMNRPLIHAVHQVQQHTKPFRESMGWIEPDLAKP